MGTATAWIPFRTIGSCRRTSQTGEQAFVGPHDTSPLQFGDCCVRHLQAKSFHPDADRNQLTFRLPAPLPRGRTSRQVRRRAAMGCQRSTSVEREGLGTKPVRFPEGRVCEPSRRRPLTTPTTVPEPAPLFLWVRAWHRGAV